jgi:DNA-binding beta-propeller fold protein YncE
VASAAPKGQRDVLVVSNNWAGTADLVDPHTFKRLKRINVVPDRAERIAEIQADPAHKPLYDFIRENIGEGHDQYVDDGFTSKDGRYVYFSRPSFADVVAIHVKTGEIAWRVRIDGYRADHMALSPDGRRLLVSASTARNVNVIDTARGTIVGRIPSGDQPHESNFSRDGKLIYHASIGSVYTGTDDPSEDSTKGERVFEIIDARTLQVKRRIDMGKEVAEFGRRGMSSAVRPMAFSPDERFVYFQLSFFHGFVEYDLKQNRVRRLALLPLSARAKKLSREDYLLDSAHHGLTINAAGTKFCVAGTMSNYAAVVRRRTLQPQRIIPVGRVPYWSTSNGRYCFVSVAGDDRVSVISWKTAREVARIRVGDHPQRMRVGTVRAALVR